MIKRHTVICIVMFFTPFLLFAQQMANKNTGKEIKNSVSAVKQANPGDYIILPSGKKYVLTGEEIDIVKGNFDYKDLSGVETETRSDGTEIKTISEAHTAFIYPDGQSTHILKTGISFTLYKENHIEKKYNIGYYVDEWGERHDFRTIDPPRFDVFRASIQFRSISDGDAEAEEVAITAYNYKGENFLMKYFSNPGFAWGYVMGSWEPKGETRKIEFDIE